VGDSAILFVLDAKIKRAYVASTISSLTVLLVFGTLVTGIALILGTTVTNEVNLTIRTNDLVIRVSKQKDRVITSPP
jgi:hypothetical protein